MKRNLFFYLLTPLLFILVTESIIAGQEKKHPLFISGLVTIKASIQKQPPTWAIIERQLIKTMEEAAPFYLQRFTRRGGTIYGGGPYDDVYEMFFNWPLFYAIGADEKLLDWALQEYNSITRHCTVYPPQKEDYFHQLYNEFPRQDDWFHISEGMMAFYDFGVADPTIPENIDRSKRFASFYMNDDPEAPNYDPTYKIIRSPFTGSKGPQFTVDTTSLKYRLDPQYGWTTLYPIIKDLEPDWDKSPERRKQIKELYDKIVMQSDAAVNLAATGLVTNAYLYTGEEKYRQWVLDYVTAWMERIRNNNGIIPDNIGPTGEIGEFREGQWWGGHFGWTSRYSIHMIYGALSVAAECAQLVSGDSKYLDILRSQIDMLLRNAIVQEGQLLVPYNYGPNGWISYRPMIIRDLAHLWHASMDPKDWQQIENVREGSKFKPLPYSGLFLNENWKPTEKFDCNYVASIGDRDDNNAIEFPRLQYYAGQNPDWPEKILKADFETVGRRMEFMRSDTRDIYSINGDDLYPNNPVIIKGLMQVTMGTPQTIYNGGLLRARVRYFDLDRSRPGLPEDVSALVEKLEAGRTVVNLINLSVMNTRNVLVQAGAFGEHQFTEVKFWEESHNNTGKFSQQEKTISINGRYFAVQLPPSTTIVLDIGTRLFANRPGYAFPWHGDKITGK